jgi:hypothetical protein
MDLNLPITETAADLETEDTTQRLKLLSHSSRLLLHTCPRKYQLSKLGASGTEDDEDTKNTFGFGHLVGTGIQNILQGKDIQQVIFESFLAWERDLFFIDEKRKKSFAHGVYALHKIRALFSAGLLKDYELVTVEGKPACELGFRVHLPNGYKYRGYVDVVLRHKITGEVMVLEIKTSSSQVVANGYKNSGQAIGYSVILDTIFPYLSAYKVLYLVYKTKEQEYEIISYPKTLYQRALWLNELLIDCETIELYNTRKVFPMHGENCIQFFRECQFFGLCTMSTESIVKKTESAPEPEYDFEINFETLVNTQLGDPEALVAPVNTGYVPSKEDVIL